MSAKSRRINLCSNDQIEIIIALKIQWNEQVVWKLHFTGSILLPLYQCITAYLIWKFHKTFLLLKFRKIEVKEVNVILELN